jgi:hypothetical protein
LTIVGLFEAFSDAQKYISGAMGGDVL